MSPTLREGGCRTSGRWAAANSTWSVNLRPSSSAAASRLRIGCATRGEILSVQRFPQPACEQRAMHGGPDETGAGRIAA